MGLVDLEQNVEFTITYQYVAALMDYPVIHLYNV